MTHVNHKTQLLISVTSVDEAKIALDNGADIIDLKDPSAGALGALPAEVIQSVVSFVKSQPASVKKLTSATIGDLPMEPALVLSRVTELSCTGVDIIKIGFFETDNFQPCLNALEKATQAGLKLIAVLFGEYTYPPSIIKEIKQAGFMGVMLDTAKKNGLTLLSHYGEERLKQFSEEVFAQDMLLGLAGSLNFQHIDTLQYLRPSYLGFRGGVCNKNQRVLNLDAEKIKAIRKLM